MTDGTGAEPDDGSEDAEGPEPLVPDAGSGRGVRRQREKVKTADQLAGEFWTAVLADPVGRAEMWRILSSGGAFKAPFACGPNGFPQPEATWFKAGQQALVLGEYHRLLRHDLPGVRMMLLEHDPAWKKPE